MTAHTRRRRPAHRRSRGRSRAPLVVIIAAVVLVGLSFPVARALSNHSKRRVTAESPAATQPSSSSTVPSSSSTATSSTAPPSSIEATPTLPARSAPGIRIRVVPALRDVQVTIDLAVYTTDRSGIIDAPDVRGTVDVAFLGYYVIPPLQQVVFRSWSDGSTGLARKLDANGRGHINVAVDLQYRVTVNKVPSGGRAQPGALTASSAVGQITFEDGTPRWVLAQRGQVSAAGEVVRRISYTFGTTREAPFRPQRFLAGPEDVWDVHTD